MCAWRDAKEKEKKEGKEFCFDFLILIFFLRYVYS